MKLRLQLLYNCLRHFFLFAGTTPSRAYGIIRKKKSVSIWEQITKRIPEETLAWFPKGSGGEISQEIARLNPELNCGGILGGLFGGLLNNKLKKVIKEWPEKLLKNCLKKSWKKCVTNS